MGSKIAGFRNLASHAQHYMKTSIRIFIFSALLFQCGQAALAKDYLLASPDSKNVIKVSVGPDLRWSVSRENKILINPSPIKMSLLNGPVLGDSPVLLRTRKSSVNSMITAVVPVRNKQISEKYNELSLIFKGSYSLVFRAYNDGVAYRFVTSIPADSIEIKNETVVFNFNEDLEVYLPLEKDPDFQSHYEAAFKKTPLSEISAKQYGYLPLYAAAPAGVKMIITEADLNDYPNLFLFGTGTNSLSGSFPPVILENKIAAGSDRKEVNVKTARYIAKTKGTRSFPWRTMIISADDKGLLETDLVYKLASPNVIKNTSWIKPGKVAWDWWNANNIYGVDFKSGINNDTYKYYVDFASEFGLEYIILDEGWTRTTTDLLHPAAGLDVADLINYAGEKKVGVILWCLWKPLDKDMDKILDQYAAWGAKGIKVDFMARADQYMVNFYARTAEACAARNLLVDFHGAYKPVGLNRTYPNVINYEGVRGLENNKWEESITPEHNVELPFTRMAAGPMDYTPGAMLNGDKKSFHINFNEPMSMGTRSHQVAMYVVYDAPLQMLADNPSNYRRDPECTRFISRIPTVWDRTIGISGKAGEYVAVARKNGDKWYIAAMTNWDKRNLDVPLNFLDKAKYKIEICQDGVNADKHAADYKIVKSEVSFGETLKIEMAGGGGFTAVLTPVK